MVEGGAAAGELNGGLDVAQLHSNRLQTGAAVECNNRCRADCGIRDRIRVVRRGCKDVLSLTGAGVDKVYSVDAWSKFIKKRRNYLCEECGSAEDVQVSHIVPPSMGGRRTAANGIALCLRCHSKRLMPRGRIRFNFSIPEGMFETLGNYCEASGRSANDVIKQLMADCIFGSMNGVNGYRDGERNSRRIGVSVLRTVYDLFVSRCAQSSVSNREMMKSLIWRHLRPFSEGNV